MLPKWHLVFTRSKYEKKVTTRLDSNEIPHFLPLKREIRKWHDRKKVVKLPLFPGYIFVNIRNQADYFKTLELEGVLGFVKIGRELATVPEIVINNLILLENEQSGLEVSEDFFLPGQNVIITDGPFTGLNCEIVSKTNESKLLVRIDILKRSIILNISPEFLMN
ncbi:UpxY family transcription antiterminator [Pedobacter roseus]|uniref:UpxY family transcription antiterminator n=1 Tax=Pedobacter roseus TaxID=336820 RepID=A0A7G9QKQ2_9SPHI|nr:UpxY family transcription antiterminator [Pedobacter roseus]QNN43927.1 UpxY family transcription antiterminator [Pedobacter roseus]